MVRWAPWLVLICAGIRIFKFGFSFQIFLYLILSGIIFFLLWSNSGPWNMSGPILKVVLELFTRRPYQNMPKEWDEVDHPIIQEELLWAALIFLSALVAFHPDGLGLVWTLFTGPRRRYF